MSLTNYDNLYLAKQADIKKFSFNSEVSSVFDNMIERSVPGYNSINQLTSAIAAAHMSTDSCCYDLGCSTGDNLYRLREMLVNSARLVGVDNSSAMLEKCKQRLAEQTSNIEYELQCADILQLELVPADVIIMNFTLQFIEPAKRIDMLSKIYASLAKQGVLLLAEKIQLETDQQQGYFEAWHKSFKQLQGYSQLEIEQKRAAIDKVMLLDPLDIHISRLNKVGFREVNLGCQFLNFVLLVAIK